MHMYICIIICSKQGTSVNQFSSVFVVTILHAENIWNIYLSLFPAHRYFFAFRIDLGDDALDIFYWHYISKMVELLQHFYDITLRMFGSLYVTANLFFSEMFDLYCPLSEWKQSLDNNQILMGLNMKSKFDKYWRIHKK